MPVNRVSSLDAIPAVVMIRGDLCCIVVDLLPISNPRFVWDADRASLQCAGREVRFPTEKSLQDFRGRLALGPEYVAVIEVGAAGQVVREHQINQPS